VQVSQFSRCVLIAGAALALVAVLAGAFAAHGLKTTIDARQLALFETAARYQMYHAFALLIVGGLSVLSQFSRRLLGFAAFAFTLGILLFSGSLYLLALSGIGWLGAITPLGGSAFIIGWLLLIIATAKTTADTRP
jgi:uncharacterized membrane protein YgdD (TMEM256/DUF423 family)